MVRRGKSGVWKLWGARYKWRWGELAASGMMGSWEGAGMREEERITDCLYTHQSLLACSWDVRLERGGERGYIYGWWFWKFSWLGGWGGRSKLFLLYPQAAVLSFFFLFFWIKIQRPVVRRVGRGGSGKSTSYGNWTFEFRLEGWSWW